MISKKSYHDKCFSKDRIEFQRKMVNLNSWQCCYNCEFWKEEKCSKFNTIPPVEVIVLGCEEHVYVVPF